VMTMWRSHATLVPHSLYARSEPAVQEPVHPCLHSALVRTPAPPTPRACVESPVPKVLLRSPVAADLHPGKRFLSPSISSPGGSSLRDSPASVACRTPSAPSRNLIGGQALVLPPAVPELVLLNPKEQDSRRKHEVVEISTIDGQGARLRMQSPKSSIQTREVDVSGIDGQGAGLRVRSPNSLTATRQVEMSPVVGQGGSLRIPVPQGAGLCSPRSLAATREVDVSTVDGQGARVRVCSPNTLMETRQVLCSPRLGSSPRASPRASLRVTSGERSPDSPRTVPHPVFHPVALSPRGSRMRSLSPHVLPLQPQVLQGVQTSPGHLSTALVSRSLTVPIPRPSNSRDPYISKSLTVPVHRSISGDYLSKTMPVRSTSGDLSKSKGLNAPVLRSTSGDYLSKSLQVVPLERSTSGDYDHLSKSPPVVLRSTSRDYVPKTQPGNVLRVQRSTSGDCLSKSLKVVSLHRSASGDLLSKTQPGNQHYMRESAAAMDGDYLSKSLNTPVQRPTHSRDPYASKILTSPVRLASTGEDRDSSQLDDQSCIFEPWIKAVSDDSACEEETEVCTTDLGGSRRSVDVSPEEWQSMAQGAFRFESVPIYLPSAARDREPMLPGKETDRHEDEDLELEASDGLTESQRGGCLTDKQHAFLEAYSPPGHMLGRRRCIQRTKIRANISAIYC